MLDVKSVHTAGFSNFCFFNPRNKHVLTTEEVFASHPPVPESTTYSPCQCVIFRFDDIADYWAWKVQLRVMDEFLAQGEDLSVAIVASKIGQTSRS